MPKDLIAVAVAKAVKDAETKAERKKRRERAERCKAYGERIKRWGKR